MRTVAPLGEQRDFPDDTSAATVGAREAAGGDGVAWSCRAGIARVAGPSLLLWRG